MPDDARVAGVVEQSQRRVDGTTDENGLLLVALKLSEFRHFERVELEQQQVVQQQTSDEQQVVVGDVRVAEVRSFFQDGQVKCCHVRPVK